MSSEVGEPVNVHEVDKQRMIEAIDRVRSLAPPPLAKPAAIRRRRPDGI